MLSIPAGIATSLSNGSNHFFGYPKQCVTSSTDGSIRISVSSLFSEIDEGITDQKISTSTGGRREAVELGEDRLSSDDARSAAHANDTEEYQSTPPKVGELSCPFNFLFR